MAVGLERAHAQLFGQGEGLAVVGGGLLVLPGLVMRGDRAEESQVVGLLSPFPVGLGEREGTQGQLVRLLHAPSQHIGLAQPGERD